MKDLTDKQLAEVEAKILDGKEDKPTDSKKGKYAKAAGKLRGQRSMESCTSRADYESELRSLRRILRLSWQRQTIVSWKQSGLTNGIRPKTFGFRGTSGSKTAVLLAALTRRQWISWSN